MQEKDLYARESIFRICTYRLFLFLRKQYFLNNILKVCIIIKNFYNDNNPESHDKLFSDKFAKLPYVDILCLHFAFSNVHIAYLHIYGNFLAVYLMVNRENLLYFSKTIISVFTRRTTYYHNCLRPQFPCR